MTQGVRAVCCALAACCALVACTTTPTFPPAAPSTGKRPQPAERGLSASDLAKSDIDVVAELHAKECLASARLLMEKLSRRNPREFRKGGHSTLEAAVARAFDPRFQFVFPELDQVRGTDAIQLALKPRIEATNFALAADDGAVTADYERADVILIGVSRSGKTPTCIYMAMQYGVFAANYPFTEDDFDRKQLPASVRRHTPKLFGLTISPLRLQQIRNERRPGSRYASISQCEFEVRSAENLFHRHGIPAIDTTECSIEEIASRIINRKGIERRLRP